MNTKSFTLPHDAIYRMVGMFPGERERWAVLIARGTHPRLEDLLKPGGHAALLTHDEGVSWPGPEAEAIAGMTLDDHGLVAMAFVSLADAGGCMSRLNLLREGQS